MKYSFRNKRGDIPSMIFTIISIFLIGVLFFFTNHMTDQIYTKFDKFFNETPKYNESEARTALQDIHTAENNLWDYMFLLICVGMFLVMGFSAYSTRISPIFYWIYGVLAMVLLTLSTILSNIWQQMASNPEFSQSITRFPITNAILGSYYPTVVIGILVITMVFLFGKPPGGNLQ